MNSPFDKLRANGARPIWVASSMTKLDQSTNTELSVVGFVCNWGAYSAVEMAGVNGKEYSPSIKLVKAMCLGRLHLGIVLRAFELGADGVLLLGCPPEECHYESGADHTRAMVAQAKKVLGILGIDPRRLALVEVPLGRDDELIRRVSAFVKYVKKTSFSSTSGDRVSNEAVEEAVCCHE